MLSYVFLTVLDLPARFLFATFHVDKLLQMAAKLGDCRKLGKFTEVVMYVVFKPCYCLGKSR